MHIDSIPRVLFARRFRLSVALLTVVVSPAACVAPPIEGGGGSARDADADRVQSARAHERGESVTAGRPAAGDGVSSEERSLADLVTRALSEDPGIHERTSAWRAALERARVAGGWPDAQLRFGHFLEPVETRTGPQRNRFSISQPLPWPDELDARQDSAARAAEAAWWEVEQRRVLVIAAVRSAYEDLVFLGHQLRIAADSLDLLQSLEPVVQQRFAAGGPQADLVQLQLEIALQRDRLAQLEQERHVRSSKLDPFLGEGFGGSYPLPLPRESRDQPDSGEPDAGDAVETVAGAPFEVLRSRLAEHNPELRAWAERVAAAGARSREAESAGRPDVALGVDWIDTGSARMAGVPGSSDDPLALTLQLSLPFDRGRYAAGEAASESARRAVLRGAERRRRELSVDLRDAVFRREDALRRLALHRDALLPSAHQALELTEAGYRGGSLPLSDYVARVRAVLAFEEGRFRAALDLQLALAKIEQLIGRARAAGSQSAGDQSAGIQSTGSRPESNWPGGHATAGVEENR